MSLTAVLILNFLLDALIFGLLALVMRTPFLLGRRTRHGPRPLPTDRRSASPPAGDSANRRFASAPRRCRSTGGDRSRRRASSLTVPRTSGPLVEPE